MQVFNISFVEALLHVTPQEVYDIFIEKGILSDKLEIVSKQEYIMQLKEYINGKVVSSIVLTYEGIDLINLKNEEEKL